jgi:hypothetical protein
MHQHWSGAVALAFLFTLAASATGCADSDASEGSQSQDDAIIAGTEEDPEGKGHVFLQLDGDPNGDCSGTLMANQWVLTARHCVQKDQPGGGTKIVEASALKLTMGGQSTRGADLHINDKYDVSLIRLAEPFTMNASRYFYHRPMTTLTNKSLVGKVLDCHGYGMNTLGGDGRGTLRSANLKV